MVAETTRAPGTGDSRTGLLVPSYGMLEVVIRLGFASRVVKEHQKAPPKEQALPQEKIRRLPGELGTSPTIHQDAFPNPRCTGLTRTRLLVG